MIRVRFPYGISNIEKLILQGFVFVDKTEFIERLEVQGESYVSFLRPRKFGKSLWLSILEYYYDINQKHKFELLFGKYYIGKNPTSLHNSYRILFFDFSGIDTSDKEQAKQGFTLSVQASIDNFFDRYPDAYSIDKQNYVRSGVDAEEKMTLFFQRYDKRAPIYVLFDEYDHFTNDILYRSLDEFVDSVSKQGYIRKFYEVIKSAARQGIVDRVFITGVSPLTLDALTSGFNILKDLTHHPVFETMLGFTESEVFNLVCKTTSNKRQRNQIMQELKEWYNGYRFCKNSQQSIYNPNMVLYYLDNFKDTQSPPDELLDPNIAPDYGKLKQMFKVVNLPKNQEVLEKVLQNGYIDAELVTIFNFERGFNQTDFINFLAYLGNLTIGGIDEITRRIEFVIPNKVIAKLYWQYYAETLNEIPELKTQSKEIDEAVIAMAKYGEYKKFFDLLENVLKTLSNRDFSKFNEKYIKVVMMSYWIVSDVFEVKSEEELGGGGYADILLVRKPQVTKLHHEYVIELKYLKKAEGQELERVKSEARTQILKYYYQDKGLQSKPYLHLLVVVCVKDKLHVEEVELSA